LKVIFTAF